MGREEDHQPILAPTTLPSVVGRDRPWEAQNNGRLEGAGARPFAILGFTVRGGLIVEIDTFADAERLRGLDLSILDD